MQKTAQAWFGGGPSSGDLQKAPSLLADWNAYASSQDSDSALGFDLETAYDYNCDQVPSANYYTCLTPCATYILQIRTAMKQEVVFKLTMCHPKISRRKAMKIAATFSGVELVAIKGAKKDELKVLGEGIDIVELVKSLRKKVCHSDLLSVGPVQEQPKKEEKSQEKLAPPVICYPNYGVIVPYCQLYEVRDPCQNACSIL